MGKERRTDFASALTTSLVFIAILFLLLGAERLFHLHLEQFGIVPRTERGLIGVAFAPLLHANMKHLLANAVPLFVLLVVLLSNPAYHPYRTLAFVWIASGFGTWLIGRGNAVHIGASSIIFGLAAFLILAGFLMSSWRSAIVAVLVFLFYGGIFYGVLPQNGPISWEGHLSGALAGAWMAIVQRKK